MTRSVATVVAEAMDARPAGWFDHVFTPDGGVRDISVRGTVPVPRLRAASDKVTFP